VVSPKAVTIATNTADNATFSCKVRSSPLPSTIYWTHTTSDEQLLNSSDGRAVDIRSYNISTSTIATVGGHQVNSHLTVLHLSNKVTGTVSCRAVYPREGGPQEQIAEAALAVLSKFSRFIVISKERSFFSLFVCLFVVR